MSFSSFFGGSKNGQFTSQNTQAADDLMWNKIQDALGGMEAPGGYQLGSSPFGFSNPVFNVMGGWNLPSYGGNGPAVGPGNPGSAVYGSPVTGGFGKTVTSTKTPGTPVFGAPPPQMSQFQGQPNQQGQAQILSSGTINPSGNWATVGNTGRGNGGPNKQINMSNFGGKIGVGQGAVGQIQPAGQSRNHGQPNKQIQLDPQGHTIQGYGQGGWDGGYGAGGGGNPGYSPLKPTNFKFDYQKTNYTPDKFTDSYTPTQFTMPTALDQKTGLFGQLLGNTNREILRNQNAAVDSQMRNAIRSGSYSPSMMKNTVLGAQKQAQEAIGDYGTRSAFDVASEVAKYQADRQQQQAGENQFASKFGFDVNQANQAAKLAGAQFNSGENKYASELSAKQQQLQADENKAWEDLVLKGGSQALEGEKLGLLANQANQDYFTKLIDAMGQNLILPYAARQKSPSMFSQLLGAGAQLGAAAL